MFEYEQFEGGIMYGVSEMHFNLGADLFIVY